MRVRERRQVATRIGQALTFLRGEATAAALDEVAAAIGLAELSIGLGPADPAHADRPRRGRRYYS